MLNFKRMVKRVADGVLPEGYLDAVLAVRYDRWREHEREREERVVGERNRQVVEALLKSGRPVCIELGADRNSSVSGWTTVDLSPDSDVCLDLARGLPFPEDSVDKLYSSHLLEHLSCPNPLYDLLGECRRVLKPGGLFSVAVPNARIYIEAYLNPETFDFEKFCAFDAGLTYRARLDYVNYIAYMGGHHKYMFDEENLLATVAGAGFRNVRAREFDPALDLEARRHETIYVEGEK